MAKVNTVQVGVKGTIISIEDQYEIPTDMFAENDIKLKRISNISAQLAKLADNLAPDLEGNEVARVHWELILDNGRTVKGDVLRIPDHTLRRGFVIATLPFLVDPDIFHAREVGASNIFLSSLDVAVNSAHRRNF